MKKLIYILITVLIPITSFTQRRGFIDFDKDEDGLIERQEFVDVFTKHYIDNWDTSEENGLDSGDFYATIFAIIDQNNTDDIRADEWNTGYELFHGDYLYDNFAMYDVDDNGSIDYVEYYDALYDSDYFVSWDVDNDGFLDQYELSNAIFENWDLNANYVINRNEFNILDDYYLDI